MCYSLGFGAIPMIPTREKAQLMSASEIERTMVRLAHEVLEKTEDISKLAFIGIRRRGVPMAQRLAAKIESLEGHKVPVGVLDIKLYRDDLSQVGEKPLVSETHIDFPVTVQGRLDRQISADIGAGGPTIRVRTHNGGVRVTKK